MNTGSGHEALFLGIDGGGTKCRARLCNASDMASGTILGSGEAGSANTTQGLDAAFQQIMSATEIAVGKAGLNADCYDRIYAGMGLAGLSLKRDFDAINTYNHPFAALHGETDAHIACLGAHQGDDGAILIIGTGTAGLLIKDGQSITVGGWGFLMSDIGSGAQLGRSALRRALEEHDGLSPQSELGSALMNEFNDNPEAMVTWSETATPKSYGSFVPEVIEYARQGDEAATALLYSTARDIERIIMTLRAKGADKVVLIGGMVDPITPWLSNAALAAIMDTKGTPLDGALMLAERLYKRSVP